MQAAFAASELIILDSSNWLYFLLFSEILYAIGNYDSLTTARKYCCYVCKMQKKCPRVFYDLFLICKTLEKYPQTSEDMNERLLAYASKQLRHLYKDSCFLFAVEEFLTGGVSNSVTYQ